MDYMKESLRLHGEWKGKLETVPKMTVDTKDALSVTYTPGVAAPVWRSKRILPSPMT